MSVHIHIHIHIYAYIIHSYHKHIQYIHTIPTYSTHVHINTPSHQTWSAVHSVPCILYTITDIKKQMSQRSVSGVMSTCLSVPPRIQILTAALLRQHRLMSASEQTKCTRERECFHSPVPIFFSNPSPHFFIAFILREREGGGGRREGRRPEKERDTQRIDSRLSVPCLTVSD